mgnify:CR=1 FL=1
MARLDYKVSVTPIESTAATSDSGPMQTETLAGGIRRSLGGGKSDTTWAGSDTTEWNAGVPTCVTSGGGTISSSSSDGIWIKHTGFDYDAAEADNVGSTVNTANLTVSTAGATSVTLAPGSAIFFPAPSNETFTMSDDGTPCAVEVADFT